MGLIESVLALMIFVRTIFYINRTDAKTCHVIRVSAVVLAAASLGILIAPLYGGVPDWLHIFFVSAVTLHLWSDRRSTERRGMVTQ